MVHNWNAIAAVLRDERIPTCQVERSLVATVPPCPVCNGYHALSRHVSATDHRYRDWWRDWLTIEARDDSWRARLLSIADSFARELG